MNFHPHRGSHLPPSCILLALLNLIGALHLIGSSAYGQAVEARISSVKGVALRVSSLRIFGLTRGDTLTPGDEIDTSRGGKVVVQLSDGSVIVVQPGSRIAFNDYRAATSLRDLFRIIIGRVRVRINHYGGRPNPYRVNSPTASILVRGTEFSVAVEPAGDTSVVVFDGLVEVQSLSDPMRRALVSPGHGVLVRPNEDIRFFTPGPGSEVGERSGNSNRTNQQHSNQKAAVLAGNSGDIRQFVASDYERYIDSVVEPGESPPLLRFTAFPDSHFDSQENPAYATEFNTIEGRLWIIPSFRNVQGRIERESVLDLNPLDPTDRGLLVQGTFFFPWPGDRTVIGGSVATSKSRLQSLSTAQIIGSPNPLFPLGAPATRTAVSSTETGSLTGSFVAAQRLGKEGRTSIGIGVDYLSGNGSLRGSTSLTNFVGLRAEEKLEAGSQVERLRLRFGVSQEFASGNKLGLFYRYGKATAWDRDRSRTFNQLPLSLDSVRINGQTSEIGLRLRGPITRRLFYGIEGAWLAVRLDENIRRAVIVDSTEREVINRAAFSFGIGYALRRNTVFSADLGAGYSRIRESLHEDATGNLIGDERRRGRFFSAQAGVQTDVWRELFINASLFGVSQTGTTDLKLFPDRFGRRLTAYGIFAPDGRIQKRIFELYSDIGAGWRFRPSLIGEYLFSINQVPGQGWGAPRHVFLLRYTFKPEK